MILRRSRANATDYIRQYKAFLGITPAVIDVIRHDWVAGSADRADFRAIGRIIAPWGRRIGDLRFETDGAWKRAGTTVDSPGVKAQIAAAMNRAAAAVPGAHVVSFGCRRIDTSSSMSSGSIPPGSPSSKYGVGWSASIRSRRTAFACAGLSTSRVFTGRSCS